MAKRFVSDLRGTKQTAFNIKGGSTIGSPSSGDYIIGDLYTDSIGSLYVCTASGNPGTWSLVSNSLVTTSVKSSNYTANPNELIPCDISSNSPIITLPTEPPDKTVIQVLISTGNRVGGNEYLTIKTGGSDTFSRVGGPTAQYLYLKSESSHFQYQTSTKIWYETRTANPSNFAINFPGISVFTPLYSSNISIDYTTRELTITPNDSYFDIFVTSNGIATRHRKNTVTFPPFDDTSGWWYFYFDANGVATVTQEPWTTADFPNIVTIYRLVWNATLSGSAKAVNEQFECHLNDIPADSHQWFHLQGMQWQSGLDIMHNAIVSGDPDADGRNTVIQLSSGEVLDDNLEDSIINSTIDADWNQDLGFASVPGDLKSTCSAIMNIRYQNSGGLVFRIAGTRFPFDFNVVTNVPNYITTDGTRTPVTNNYHFVYFIYCDSEPRSGKNVRLVSATSEFSNIANARAYTWTNIQSSFTNFLDGDRRPLYKLIFTTKSSYDSGCKYTVLREVQDLRKSATISTTIISSSLPATSVTFVPYGTIGSTNVQSAMDELIDETVPLIKVTASTAKMTELSTGFKLAGGTTEKTLTVPLDASVSNTNTGDVTLASSNHGLALTNQVIALGTPSTLTTSTTNTVTNATHTHAITAAIGLIGNGTAQYQLPVTGATPFAPVWTTATGTGSPVLETSPTLVTPTLGVASVTSINKVTVTTPATSAVLTISDGKTLSVSNTLTLAGSSDGLTVTIPATGTVALLGTANTFTTTQKILPDTDVNPLTIESSGTTDSTRAIWFNVGGTNYAKIMVPVGSGGALAFWVGTSGAASERIRIKNDGTVGIGTATPGSRLDISAGAFTMSEMSAPSAPAANGVVIYAVDNGAGKTKLMALFNTGAAQQLAIQP